MRVPATSPVVVPVGRDAEMVAIDGFLAGIRTTGRMLALAGSAGMGKSTLWRWALASAPDHQLRVLSFAAVEGERQLGLAAVAELLDPCIDEVLAALPRLQSQALAIATFRAPSKGVLTPRRVAAALTAAIRTVAADRPLLLAIDDLQWVDRESLAALQYAMRRVDDLPVGLLVTVRTPDTDEALAALGSAIGAERVERVSLAPLALSALHHIVFTHLGMRLPPHALATIDRLARGKPLHALEAARLWLQRRPDGSTPLSAPSELAELMHERVTALPAQVRDLLACIFALARPSLRSITTLFGDSADAVVAEAEEAGVVVVVEHSAVRAAHPLLASSAYELLSPDARRRLHRRLAAYATDVEERARHRALAAHTPNPAVATVLDAAAASARSRGAAAAAADFGSLALSFTPADELHDVVRRTFAVALDEYRAGNAHEARRRWRWLADDTALDACVRAQALWSLATFHGSPHIAGNISALETALRLASGETALCARVRAGLSEMLLAAGRARDAEMQADAARSLAPAFADAATRAAIEGPTSLALFAVGRLPAIPSDDSSLLDHALQDMPVEVVPSLYRCLLRVWERDHLDIARSALLEAWTAAECRGDEVSLPLIAVQLTEAEAGLGEWGSAARHAEEAATWAQLTGTAHLQGYCAWASGLVAAMRGDLASARESAMRSLAADEWREVFLQSSLPRALLGFVELCEGRPHAATEWFRPLHETVLRGGHQEPYFWMHAPDFVESLTAIGRIDEADAVLQGFTECAERLGRQWAMGAATRSRAKLLVKRGESEEAEHSAQRSVTLLRDVRLPFELARSLLTLGMIQRRRRHGNAAAASLAEAASIFALLGARVWLQWARQELDRATPVRVGRWRLTASEQRVAELVVAGKSNREIAGALFLSEKTVEWHLGRTFAKLGVRSRTQLAARLRPVADVTRD